MGLGDFLLTKKWPLSDNFQVNGMIRFSKRSNQQGETSEEHISVLTVQGRHPFPREAPVGQGRVTWRSMVLKVWG